jgi:hypothetical protein
VIEERTLPHGIVLAEQVNEILGEAHVSEAGSVTASMVETIRLRWEIQRPTITKQLRTAQPSGAAESDTTQLARTRVGRAFIDP